MVAALSVVLNAAQATGQTGRPDLVVNVQSFPGVQRVVVATDNGRPVTSDLDLWIVVRCSDHRSTLKSVSRNLRIAAGTNFGVAELPVIMPSNQWYRLNLHAETDNNGIFNAGDIMQTQITQSNNWSLIDYQLFVSSNVSSIPDQSYLCTLQGQTPNPNSGLGVADPGKLPAFKQLLPFYEAQGEISPGSVTSNISFLQNANNRLKSIHPGDFFDYWTSLSLFRVIYISYSDLLLLQKKRTKIEALKKWTMAGGQLVVFDCGRDFRRRNDIHAQLTDRTGVVERSTLR